jgi:hypothetical protein
VRNNRYGADSALSDYDSDEGWLDPIVDEEAGTAPLPPVQPQQPQPPSFRELLEGALSSKSAPELQGIVDRARKPSQLQMQTAFGRLYRTERAVQLSLLPPRPSAEEDEYLSAPNKGAVRDLQEACRHNAALIQGVYMLAEALVTGKMDQTHISQLCADMLTYGFGAQEELVNRIRDIVRGSISSRFPPTEAFRYPDSYRPLDVLADTERRQALKDRKAKNKAPSARPARSDKEGQRSQQRPGKRAYEHAVGGAEKRIFVRGDQKSARPADK